MIPVLSWTFYPVLLEVSQSTTLVRHDTAITMATATTSIDHPVLRHLLTLTANMSLCLEADAMCIKSCLGTTKGGARCRKQPVSRGKANTFLDDICDMEAWPDTSDFTISIEQFLKDACCATHIKEVLLKDFSAWKTNVLPTIRSIASAPISGVRDGDPAERPKATGAARRKSGNSKREEDASIRSIIAQIIALDLTATVTVVQGKRRVSVPPGTAEIDGLGFGVLNRKGSFRDNSQIFRSMHAPLTHKEQNDGIVYVWRHVGKGDHFKIGFTGTTAIKRLQTHKCLKRNKDIEVIYESPDGPFFAAERAEHLAQSFLGSQNLRIISCDMCGGGHKEWFRAREDAVLDAVISMERFVRFPAYEATADGEWKLSDAAFEAIKDMGRLDLTKFDAALTKSDAVPIVTEEEVDPDNEVDYQYSLDHESISGRSTEPRLSREPRMSRSTVAEMTEMVEAMSIKTASKRRIG